MKRGGCHKGGGNAPETPPAERADRVQDSCAKRVLFSPTLVYYVDVYSYKHVVTSMTTIQMTLDEQLLKTLDRTVKEMRTTRSALIRESVRHYLKTLHSRDQETRHRAGYAKHPVKRGEFDVWDREQDWGE